MEEVKDAEECAEGDEECETEEETSSKGPEEKIGEDRLGSADMF